MTKSLKSCSLLTYNFPNAPKPLGEVLNVQLKNRPDAYLRSDRWHVITISSHCVNTNLGILDVNKKALSNMSSCLYTTAAFIYKLAFFK